MLSSALNIELDKHGLLNPRPELPFPELSVDALCAKVCCFYSPVWGIPHDRHRTSHSCKLGEIIQNGVYCVVTEIKHWNWRIIGQRCISCEKAAYLEAEKFETKIWFRQKSGRRSVTNIWSENVQKSSDRACFPYVCRFRFLIGGRGSSTMSLYLANLQVCTSQSKSLDSNARAVHSHPDRSPVHRASPSHGSLLDAHC